MSSKISKEIKNHLSPNPYLVEPRILFDAAAPAMVADVIQAPVASTDTDNNQSDNSDNAVQNSENTASDNQNAVADDGDTANAVANAILALDSNNKNTQENILDEVRATDADDSNDVFESLKSSLENADDKTVIVIDKSVTSLENLNDALENTNAHVVVIEAGDKAAIHTISEALNGLTDISSIHIFSHGSEDTLILGGMAITSSNLNEQANELATWSNTLTDKADILLYGCDIAKTDTAFIDTLSKLTSADVAASTNTTGSAQGNDWVLEAQTGEIESNLPFDTALLNNIDALTAPTLHYTEKDIMAVDEDTSFKLSDVISSLTVDSSATSVSITLSDHCTVKDSSGAPLTTPSFSGTSTDILTWLNGLTFQGTQDYNGSESISIVVGNTDGQTSTSTLNVSVKPVNDNPSLVPLDTINVNEGQTGAAFSESNFGLTDPDIATGNQVAQQMIVTLKTLPTQGELRLNGNAVVVGSSFAYSDIASGKLTYNHNGSDVPAVNAGDSFTVSVNDGAGAETLDTVINIKLLPVNDAPTISGDLEVYEGQTKALGQNIIISDVESIHADALNNCTLSITITQPGDGTFFIDKDGDGRYTSGTDTELTGTHSFSGSDLQNLYYAQNGAEPVGSLGANPSSNVPSFTLSITDNGGGQTDASGNPTNKLTATHDFTIKVNEVDDDPTMGTNAGENPAIVDSATDMKQDGTLDITSSLLNVEDVDTPTDNRVYVITQPPVINGTTTPVAQVQVLVGGTWLALGVGGHFTQQQINDGQVRIYRYGNVDHDDTDVVFSFTVRDSELKAWQDTVYDHTGAEGGIYDGNTNTLKVMDFHVLMDQWTSPGTPGPDFGNLVLNGPDQITLQMYEGKSDVIIKSECEFTSSSESGSVSLSANELVYRITEISSNGTLQIKVGDTWTDLGLYGNFTQQDINDNKIRFLHDGNECFTDKVVCSVTDGSNTKNVTFNIDATPINDAPTTTGGFISAVEAVTGVDGSGIVRIDDTMIHFSDADGAITKDSGPDSNKSTQAQGNVDSLWFQITSLPQDGKLQYFDSTTNTWTDITEDNYSSLWFNEGILGQTVDGHKGGLRYAHGGNDTEAALSDAFNFVVRDDLSSPNGGALFRTDAPATSNSTLDTPDRSPQSGDSDHPSYITGNNLSNVGTVTIEVAAQNDPPLIALTPDADDPTIDNTVTGGGALKGENDPLYLAEGASATITNELLCAVDTDNTTVQRQFVVTTYVEHGNLYLSGQLLTVGSTFTQADIDSGKLTYTHDGTENYTDCFYFDVDDGGTRRVEDARFDIYVNTLKNDIPVISATEDHFVESSASGVVVGGSLTITDPDSKESSGDDAHGIPATYDQISTTISIPADASGKLLVNYTGHTVTLTSTSGVDTDTTNHTYSSTTSMTFQGTRSEVEAVLKTLTFVSNGDLDKEVPITVSVNDLHRDASGALIDANTGVAGTQAGANGGTVNADTSKSEVNESNNTVSKVLYVWSSNQNDPPVVTVPSDLTAVEDTWLSIGSNSVHITDSDIPTDSKYGSFTSSVTVSVDNGGLLRTGTSGAGASSITLTGTLAQINAKLDALQFKGSTDFNDSSSTNSTITVTYNDNGNIGVGDSGTQTSTFNVKVDAVNDAPSIAGGPTSQTIIGNEGFTFAGDNKVTLGDAKDFNKNFAATDNFTLTISAVDGNGSAFGTLSLPSGVSLTDTNSADNIIVLTGTLENLNTAIDGLKFKQPDGSGDSAVKINFLLDDYGNGDKTGPTSTPNGVGHTATHDYNFFLSQVNDVPTVNTPDSITVVEDSSNNNLNNIVFADTDDNGSTHNTVVLDVSHGALNLSDEALAGLTILDGENHSGHLKLQGTLAKINAAMAALTYTPNGDFNGSDTLNAVYADDASSSLEGLSKTVSVSQNINVTAINDAPTGTISALLPTIDQGTSADDIAGITIAQLVGNSMSDARDNVSGGTSADSFMGIAITANNATSEQGTWQHYNGCDWIDIGDLSLEFALYLSADCPIRFVPNGEFNSTPGTLVGRYVETFYGSGVPVVRGYVDLSGENASGGTTHYSDADNTITIGTSIKAKPTIVVDTSINTTEDYTNVSLGTVSVTGDSLRTYNASVNVEHGSLSVSSGDTNPSAGVVTLSGTIAQINAALASLTYTPVGDFNGSDHLTITITDKNDAALTNTTTSDITVAPVNDAPTGTISALLPAIDQGTSADDIDGITIAQLVINSMSDARDNVSGGTSADSFMGIAITGNGATSEQGTWQYYNGSSWTNIGNVSLNSALYLSSDTQIRFVPNGEFNSTPGSLVGRYVETFDSRETAPTNYSNVNLSGANASGGITHYSDSDNTVTIGTSIRADINILVDTTINTTEDYSNVSLGTVSVTGDPLRIYNASVNVEHGSLNVSSGDTNPSAGVVTLSGTIAQINAALASLTYTPNGDFNGSDHLTITITAKNDVTQTNTTISNITVAPINDAPTGHGSVNLPNLESNDTESEGYTISSLVLSYMSDARDNVSGGSSANTFCGIVITNNGANPDTQGSWQYFDGSAWVDVGNVSQSMALTLSADTKVRFVPVEGYSGHPGALTTHVLETGATNTTGLIQNVSGENSGGITHIAAPSEIVYLKVVVGSDPEVIPPTPITSTTNNGDVPPVITTTPLVHPSDPTPRPMPNDVNPALDPIKPGETGNPLSWAPPSVFGDLFETTKLSYDSVMLDLTTTLNAIDWTNPFGWALGEHFDIELTDQRVEVGTQYEFNIPAASIHHTNPNIKIVLQATLADGSELPDWIIFDAQERSFKICPHVDSHEVAVKVRAVDADGQEADAVFAVKPEVKSHAHDNEKVPLADNQQSGSESLTQALAQNDEHERKVVEALMNTNN